MTAMPVPEGQRLTADQPLFFHETASKLASHLVVSPGCNCGDVPCSAIKLNYLTTGFAPIFPDTCYHLTHYWLAAADIPVASDNPVHYADAIRYNARTPLQGSLLPLTRLVWA